MAEVSVDYINPFLESSMNIIKGFCGYEMKIGKPFISKAEVNDKSIMIMLGVTGAMSGQVILDIPEQNACEIASKMMMGMPVEKLDDMSLSAISELGNMIMGHAGIILSNKGINIDITPPTLGRGNMKIESPYTQNICVPLTVGEEKLLDINISIKVK